MPIEQIKIDISVNWRRLKNRNGEPYKWGDDKTSADPNWSKSNVIYRWVKNSTKEIAEIGETGRRLTNRINNYIYAGSSGAGLTNRRVYNEQQRLSKSGDFLYLEFTDDVPGYNLRNNRERKLAESLLIGYYRPYLQ